MTAPPHTTAVDGHGMWRSWTRVFRQPESAGWDLLDNCFDAAIGGGDDDDDADDDDFIGQVTLEEALVNNNNDNSGGTTTSSFLLIQNNSWKPIRGLKDVLTVYQSQKNANITTTTGTTSFVSSSGPMVAQPHQTHPHTTRKDAIGENGVGLKHGCAALSDCSLVLTRNGCLLSNDNSDNNNNTTIDLTADPPVWELGVIAKDLQSTQGVYLPSTRWTTNVVVEHHQEASSSSVTATTVAHLTQWLDAHPDIAAVLQKTLHTSTVRDTVQVLHRTLVQRLVTRPWRHHPHVFLLALGNTLKQTVDVAHTLVTERTRSTQTFLQYLKRQLPVQYIHLPRSLRVQIIFSMPTALPANDASMEVVDNDAALQFCYWQGRLVELTLVEVHVSPTVPLAEDNDQTWAEPGDDKYTFRIYCGFDAQRVQQDLSHGQGTSPCHLHIYSCAAGRLIQTMHDARHALGLSTSGVDYTQGLTVLVADGHGRLPLTPTKDDIAWSERPSGDVFKANLMAWTGAVAHLFWTYHIKKSFGRNSSGGRSKEMLKKTVQFFADIQRQQNMDQVTQNLQDAQVTTFTNIAWARRPKTHGLYWIIRQASGTPSNFTITPGKDTLFRFSKERLQEFKALNSPKHAPKPKAGAAPAADAAAPARHATLSPPNFCDVTLDEDEEGPIPVLPSPEGEDTHVDDDSWAEIDKKYIPRVTMTMLKYLRSLDETDLFEEPVIETYPWLKEKYLKVVWNPMDFQTIESKRMSTYTSVNQLKKDLLLVFQNCKAFNDDSGPYADIANTMISVLDDAYQKILQGKRLSKPSHRLINIPEPSTKRAKKTINNGATPPGASLRQQLQIERRKVAQLQQQLSKRDLCIQELEALLPDGVRSPRRFALTSRLLPDVPVADAVPSSTTNYSEPYMDEGCERCNSNDHPERIIICDSCDREYHTYCLTPPLAAVPPGDWFCPKCVEDEDYAVINGPTYRRAVL